MTHRPTTHRIAGLALAGLLALGLGACSGGGASDSAGAAAAASGGQVRDMGAAAPGQSAADAANQATATLAEPKIARRADTAIVVKDIDGAAAQIRTLAATAGGAVLNESLTSGSTDASAATVGTMSIQVPADKLDDTLSRLAELGDMVSRNTNADDVSAAYVDTEARVKSMQASVDRMRTLMSQATAISDIIAIEGELSRRQADLEALEAQMKSLEGQVAMAPISIRLTTNQVDLGVDGGGFLGGLKAGWTAFVASVNFLLMALGALLPFAVAAAIVLVPLVMWLRRRARAAHLPPAGPATPTGVPAQPAPTTPQPDLAHAASPAPDRPADPNS